jgi:hypothetical protein
MCQSCDAALARASSLIELNRTPDFPAGLDCLWAVFDRRQHHRVRLSHFCQIDGLQLGAVIGQLLAEAPLRTYGPHPVTTSATSPLLTALGDQRLRAAVGLWQLQSQTCRSLGRSVADRVSGSGRIRVHARRTVS